MADNYLEKRYEQVYGCGSSPGSGLIRRPSLDSLFDRCSHSGGFCKDYAVHRLQLEAIAAAPARAGLCADGELSTVLLPSAAAIAVCSASGESVSSVFKAGRIIQTMVLKAAEMGLGTRVEYCPDGEFPELGTAPLAIAYIGKPAAKEK